MTPSWLSIYSFSERAGGIGQSILKCHLGLYFPQAWRSQHLKTIPLRPDKHLLPIKWALRYPDELLDYYLSLPQLRGEQMCVGLNLQVNQRSWTDHVTGQFWHCSQWFDAVAQVITAPENQEVNAFVWERSHLSFRQRQGTLILRDAEVTDGFAWSPIMMSLQEFTQQILQVAHEFQALLLLLNQELALRGGLHPKINADLCCRYRVARTKTNAAVRRFNLIWRELNDFPDTVAHLQTTVQTHKPNWLAMSASEPLKPALSA